MCERGWILAIRSRPTQLYAIGLARSRFLFARTLLSLIVREGSKLQRRLQPQLDYPIRRIWTLIDCTCEQSRPSISNPQARAGKSDALAALIALALMTATCGKLIGHFLATARIYIYVYSIVDGNNAAYRDRARLQRVHIQEINSPDREIDARHISA